MRIISGSRRGKKLFSVPGLLTRPTSDRVKESIFNILPQIDTKTVVLDLFAGTGALALEALSRGASYAVLIDSSKAAVNIIQRNLAACKFMNCAEVKICDLTAAPQCLEGLQQRFNLLFMDPPYGQNIIGAILERIVYHEVLVRDARIIIEHGIKDKLPPLPIPIQQEDERKYGKTLVSFLRYM